MTESGLNPFNLMTLILLASARPIESKVCFSELSLCSSCNSTFAICHTYSTEWIIPQNLSFELNTLTVTYDGPPAALRRSQLQRYPKLESITVSGNICSVEVDSISHLRLLTNLAIVDTYVTYLPTSLFHPNNSLAHLELQDNELSQIPTQLFIELPHLKYLNLGFNYIVLENCSTIGEEFFQLTNLSVLNLANLSAVSNCTDDIGSDLFLPVKNTVERLNLTNTNISHNLPPKIFTNFTKLRELDLSLAEGLRDCPAAAEELFENLPRTLESLIIQRWRPTWLSKCTLNSTSISGLRTLPRLKVLDFSYSTGLFGRELQDDVFSRFYFLEYLNLKWCMIGLVGQRAFDYCRNLNWLSFDGNPIGDNMIQLSYFKHPPLKYLGLANTMLYSDYSKDVKLKILLHGTAGLQVLNMSRNFLQHMPIFHGNLYEGGGEIRSIVLDFNFLVNLRSNSDRSFDATCYLLSKLSYISLRSNNLVDIEGLCPTLQHLDLAENKHLKDSWAHNEDVIKKLYHLENLNLHGNDINNFSVNAFSSMLNLTEVILADNNLSYVSADLFRHNKKLQVIDLSYNLLKEVKSELFAHLDELRYLNLLDNQITYLDLDLTEYFDSSPKLQEVVLLDNPLSCQCKQGHVQGFLRRTNKVPDVQKLTCAGPTNDLRGKMIFAYSRDTFVCDHRENVIVAGSVLGSFLVTLLIALPCYKYRWYFKHLRTFITAVLNRINEVRFHYKCQYDALVIYDSDSEVDCDFIVNHLCEEVENTSHSKNNAEELKLYFLDRDAIPGDSVYSSLASALESSRKIILVLSNSFLLSDKCKGLADLAGHEAYNAEFYQPNRIVVLVRESLNEDIIQVPFSSLLTETVIDVYDKNDKAMTRIWQRVRNFISKPEYQYRKQKKMRQTTSGQSHEDVQLENRA